MVEFQILRPKPRDKVVINYHPSDKKKRCASKAKPGLSLFFSSLI